MLNNLPVEDLRYYCPERNATGFPIYNKKACTEYMLDDLAKSGLEPDQIGAYVTTQMDLSPWGATVAYYLPYYDPFKDRVCRENGELLMYRLRMLDGHDKKTGKPQRYTQPGKKKLAPHGYFGNTPYILPRTMELLKEQKILYVCEGEKKSACFIHYLDKPAIGIGGYQSWRGEGSDLHPWISRLVREQEVEEVVIIPDGDIYRIDICQGYSGMADRLKQLGVEVSIVAMPKESKLDDELVARGPEGEAWFESLGKLDTEGLVIDPMILVRDYGCSLNKQNALVCNENNYRRLLREHPAFGEFELNTDTMDYYHRGEQIDFAVFENVVASHFQHYFQMHSATPERIMKTAIALCKEHKKSFFLEGIPEWDGVERLETMFVDLWGVEDNEINRELGLKFMTSAYARMYDPGCKVDWMLVTTGGQGLGKTYFAEVLFKGHHVNIIGQPSEKDLDMLLHSGLVAVFDEMATMHSSNKSREFWKGKMTQPHDFYRPPYERATGKFPRSCIFYGTTNHKDVIEADEGGNRRWAVLEVKQLIDFDRLFEIRDQLWAEAKVKYEHGQPYGQISQAIMDHVEREHTAEDLLNIYIAEYLEACWNGPHRGKFYTTELHQYLDSDGINLRRSTKLLKSVLTTKFGCEYKKVRRENKNQMGYEMTMWPVVGKNDESVGS